VCAYTPQSNGLAERRIKEVKCFLLASRLGNRWSNGIPAMMKRINLMPSATDSSSSATPFSLFFKRNFSEQAERLFQIPPLPVGDDEVEHYRLHREESVGYRVHQRQRAVPKPGSKVLILRNGRVVDVVRVNADNSISIIDGGVEKRESLRNVRPYFA
jgi:hypothetical protein